MNTDLLSRSKSLVQSRMGNELLIGLIVFSALFSASYFGIKTRPLGFLAAFWPANAILLGLMVRFPRLCVVSGWTGAVIGYLTADLLTGSTLFVTSLLTLANLAGAMTGVVLFYKLSEEDRRLQRPLSVLFLFVISVMSGTMSGLVGGGAAIALFGKDMVTGFAFWFTTELVNDLLLLPVILTFPAGSRIKAEIQTAWNRIRGDLLCLAPLLSLILSLVVTVVVGGPGAIGFTVPALLWCSLTYRLFSTAVLTLFTLAGMMIGVTGGLIQVLPVSHDFVQETMSLRLGIALLALVPLTACSIDQARNDLIARLHRALEHDFLTDTLARRSFMEQASAYLESTSLRKVPTSYACLMIDLDHFKSVNDQYGHAAGDEVLVTFSRIVKSELRKDDLFGRIGGEEFAVLLANTDRASSQIVADRLREIVAQTPIMLPDGRSLQITISLGMTFVDEKRPMHFQELLNSADEALYRAKSAGRNQVRAVIYKA